jgi:hypothetical protein
VTIFTGFRCEKFGAMVLETRSEGYIAVSIINYENNKSELLQGGAKIV